MSAAAAAFSAATLAGSETLEAEIINSGINNLTFGVAGSGSTSLGFDLNGDMVNDGTFVLSQYYSSGYGIGQNIFRRAFFRVAPGAQGVVNRGIVRTTSSYPTGFYAGANANLPFDFSINNPLGTGYFGTGRLALDYGESGPSFIDAFRYGSTGFAGFAFTSGSEQRYGWLRVRFDIISPLGGGQEFSLTLVDGAYDDSGNGIGAGVPEPGSLSLLGLLALGCVGLRESRRRVGDRKSNGSDANNGDC